MNELRLLFFSVILFFAAGCASNDQWQAENIPYPRVTPYDANEFARRAYLDGFQSGYRSESGGESTTVDVLAPPHLQARRLGFHAGVAKARSERAARP